MDAIIEWVERGVPPNHFANAVATGVEPDCVGRQLAIDVLVYGTAPSHIDSYGTHTEDAPFEKLDDPDFTKALSREILAVQGNSLLQEPSRELSKILTSGLLAVENEKARHQSPVKKLPVEHPCKYHQHTELGMPCYKTKR